MTLSVTSGFPYYISKLGEEDLFAAFEKNDNYFLLQSITEQKSTFRYAEGKWSIKQLLGHIIDHERIMSYRVLRFSRKDFTILSGYDQDLLVANGRFDERTFQSLVKEYSIVRKATLCLLESLSPEQLQLKGTAWKFELKVEEFLKATIGHEYHHIEILKERYLQ